MSRRAFWFPAAPPPAARSAALQTGVSPRQDRAELEFGAPSRAREVQSILSAQRQSGVNAALLGLRAFVSFAIFCVALFALTLFAAAEEQSRTNATPTVIVVTGAAGEEEFGKHFATWADAWRKAAQLGGARLIDIGPTNAPGITDRDRLQQAIADEAKSTTGDLWLVFLGHGTFDGKEAKFNLTGPDVGAGDLADWLKPVRRPLAIIDTSSASGPFIKKLSASGRVIVTATRSGSEESYARFGEFLSVAIIDPQADLDRDGQISLLEAFLSASHKVTEFYRAEGRLATEHALLDDNGDGLGTPPDWFRGTRAVKRASEGAAPDGLLAAQFCLVPSDFEKRLTPAQRQRRNQLETSIARLRDIKTKIPEAEYYQQLEPLLLELARLYKSVK